MVDSGRERLERRWPVLLLLSFVFFVPCRAFALPVAPKTVELVRASFAKEVERVNGAVNKLGGDSAAAQVLRNSLPEKWVVLPEAGRGREEISTEGLTTLLVDFQKYSARRKELRERLLATCAEMARLAEVLGAAASGARGEIAARPKLEDILRRSEFNSVARPSLWDIWRGRILAWILEFLDKLFGERWYTQRAGVAAVWVLIGLAFLILALWLGRHLARSRLQMLSIEPPVPAGKSWRDWAREARAAAGEERHREALHAAYWAAIFRLEDLGAWTHDRTRTPREYLRMLGTSHAPAAVGGKLFSATPAQKTALESLTVRFEVTWYGYREAGENDFRHAVAQLEALGCRLS